MKRLFKISSGEHGKGDVIVKWQPEGNLLATAGKNGKSQPLQVKASHVQRIEDTSCLWRVGLLLVQVSQ